MNAISPSDLMRRFPWLALTLALLTIFVPVSRADLSPDTLAALAWYDTLGFPDAKDLPHVRVATGRWSKSGNQPPENSFVEGFLLRDEPDAFTVFLCSVSDFKERFEFPGSYPPLTTARFVRKTVGPAYGHVDYEVLDFNQVSGEVVKRVRETASKAVHDLQWGRPVTHRVRIFAFARACLQKGLSETASVLMTFAAGIPEEQTGKTDQPLREMLQWQIGDAVLARAEIEASQPAIPWPELLKTYEDFDTRFPASPEIAYARENAEVLRKMIAEEAVHHPKPLEEMSLAEEVAENIYQVRNLREDFWTMHDHYPDLTRQRDGKDVITPVHRLTDLGYEAVPQLIAALDDRSFTRSEVPSHNFSFPTKAMRVSDFARSILEHFSGRNFFERRTDDGRLVNGMSRQAELWWAEVQRKGAKQQLIDAASAGGIEGSNAARKLVEKYPDAALPAIEAGFRATSLDGERVQFVAVAAVLPGNVPVAFLRSKLARGNGLHTRVEAAKALFARGRPDAVPAMLEAWRNVQPRLPANQSDAYSEVGGIITFLAKSGNPQAIAALAHEFQKVPVEVRFAIVHVFLPFPQSADFSAIGVGVNVEADMANLPAGDASHAIERLLVSALTDTGRRVGMKGHYNEASFEDPRICDLAALVLSKRWPEKYRFIWSATAEECDAQIAVLRDQ